MLFILSKFCDFYKLLVGNEIEHQDGDEDVVIIGETKKVLICFHPNYFLFQSWSVYVVCVAVGEACRHVENDSTECPSSIPEAACI